MNYSSDTVQPELNKTSNSSNVCPGETVAFTCETRGTDNQTWKFKYLGNQSQITITVSNRSTLLQSSDVTAQAILAETLYKNDFTVLKGVFNVTLTWSAHYGEDLSITCQNDELMSNSTITLTVDRPGTLNVEIRL